MERWKDGKAILAEVIECKKGRDGICRIATVRYFKDGSTRLEGRRLKGTAITTTRGLESLTKVSAEAFSPCKVEKYLLEEDRTWKWSCPHLNDNVMRAVTNEEKSPDDFKAVADKTVEVWLNENDELQGTGDVSKTKLDKTGLESIDDIIEVVTVEQTNDENDEVHEARVSQGIKNHGNSDLELVEKTSASGERPKRKRIPNVRLNSGEYDLAMEPDAEQTQTVSQGNRKY